MNRLLYVFLCVSFVVWGSPSHAQESSLPLVSQIDWSSDGAVILVTMQQGGLYTIDPYTQTVLLELPGSLTGAITDAVLQPGGNLIATIGGYNTLNIWDSESGALIRSLTTGVFPYSVDWSPDGQYLFSSNIDELVMRDSTGNPLFTIPGAPEDVPLVEFSPNGILLLLSFSPKIEVWDVTSRQMLVRNLAPGLIQSIQWSADGIRILAANLQNTREGALYNIFVINPMTGEHLRVYSGFPDELTFARWSPDETQILATSIDGTAYLVDAASGRITTIFTTNAPLLSADWSPYGGQIAIGASLSSETTQAMGNTDTALPIQILVPDPSLERLQSIAELCNAPLTVAEAIPDAAQTDQLADFITQIESLPADSIPPACAADLIAVAEAIQPGE